MSWFGIASFAFAAAVYGLIAAIAIAGHTSVRRELSLIVASVTSSLWGAGSASLLLWSAQGPSRGVAVLDVVHLFVWTACVLSWLGSRRLTHWLFALQLAAGLWALLAASLAWSTFPAITAMAVLGFVAAERVFRGAEHEQRLRISLLCLTAAGVFLVDLFVYLQASLLGAIDEFYWESRGLTNAALAPLVVFAMRRKHEPDGELFVSRHVVFYAASLLGGAAYLLLMVLVAHLIERRGWEWSPSLGLLFVIATLGLFTFVLLSSGIRGRFKVFVVKHFYRNKYDYREEWLRLTQTLGKTAEPSALITNALSGLARIVGSTEADLCITRDFERYEWTASLNRDRPESGTVDKQHAVVRFLAANGWVIDSLEYARQPDRYGGSFGDPADRMLPDDSLTVPLDCLGRLQGFVVLHKPRRLRALNFEDHDLLKTAGKQVAVVLAQALAQERIAETLQFEAMNKLSAFLMHDLKNVVAQQELMVANAQHFRHRPDFIDDVFKTIRSGVERMKKVLDQLRSASQPQTTIGRVEASKILMEVRSQCADRRPIPEIALSARPVWVAMDRDKLASVLMHLIRNAQDATPPDGAIKISLETGEEHIVLTVADSGCGMDAEFLRERLFRPFDSTKGAKGMGIGAYQVRHLVRSAGGEIEVKSSLGSGTMFRLQLPIARGPTRE